MNPTAVFHRLGAWGLTLADRIYYRIFDERISDRLKHFMKNFGYLALGEVIGMAIGFPIKILVGRFLGPEEYGKYSLILNLAQFLIIPMIFGLTTAALNQIPKKPHQSGQIIKAITLTALITTSLSTLLFWFFRTPVMELFGIDDRLFKWTLVFSVFISGYYFVEAFVRGLSKFRWLFYMSVIGSVVLLSVFLWFIFALGNRTFSTFVTANIVVYGFYIVILGIAVARFARLGPSIPGLYRQVLSYSGLAMLGGVAGFLIGNTDRFFLNHYLTLYWVGVYSAYVNAASVFVGRFFALFLQVYFPAVSGLQDKDAVFHQIKKVLARLGGFVFALSFFSTWFFIWLFGKKFPIDLGLIGLFSLNNVVFIVYQLYMWLLNSQGNKGMRSNLIILYINAFLNLALFYFLIPILKVYGAIGTTLAVNLIFAFYYYFQTRHFVRNGYFNEA